MAMKTGAVLMVAAIGAGLAVPICSAQQFRSSTYGYRIDLPRGWIEAPPAVLDEVMSNMRRQGVDMDIIYDAGFQLASAEHWFEHPYVLVQPIPLPGQIHEHEFASYVEYISGIGAGEVRSENPNMNLDAANHVAAIDFQKPYLDRANRRFFMPMEVHVEGVGHVRSLTVGYFGRDSIVQVAFHALSDDWDRFASDRNALFDSFCFFPPRAYSSELAAVAGSAPSAGQRIQRAALGIGTLFAASFVIVRLVRRCCRRQPGSAMVTTG